MNQPTLYLFVGYPGSGKTTVSRMIHEHTGAVHIWADQIRQDMFGKANLDEAETARLYEQLNAETEQLLAAGKSVIFDTNFNFRKDRDVLRQLATDHGADTVVVWMTTPEPVARQRAVDSAQAHDTRIWGNMSADDFERIRDKLEPPTPDELPITIDGSEINEKDILTALNI